MKQIRLTNVVLILSLLLSMSSCDRLTGSSNVSKPTKVVDFPSIVGKSLLEMTTMLGQATERCPTCGYEWELPEGELRVSYELGDYAKKWMSSIEYKLKPDLAVSSTEEMMALLNINVQGKEAKEDRRGFFTYKDININGKSGFIDVHPRSRSIIFGKQNPEFITIDLYIHNPEINFYRLPNREGTETTFWEQKTDINVSVGSVIIDDGDWEVCTGANFTGKCKILEDKVDSEYWKNSKNFSAFGLGNTIKSVRPVKRK
jgi:hypothetical protein